MNHRTSLIALFLLLAPVGSALAASAGQITLLSGRATAATPAGDIRSLKKGDPVFSREYISTSSNTFVNIKFSDGGAVLIKPNSRFQIEQYTYTGKTEAGNEKAVPSARAPVARGGSVAAFSLIKGGFRAISGLIGKRDRGEYRVSTPVATIGIRGTDYTAILCDEVCAKDPIIMENVGIETAPEGGLVASVLEGGIGVTTKSVVARSLRSYQAIARALNLQPAGYVPAVYRPGNGQLRKVATGPQTHNVNQGQSYFFSRAPGQNPIRLPRVSTNVDSGLSGYNPNDICK